MNDYLQLEEGLTDEEVAERRDSELSNRLRSINLLRGLAAPWGLTPIFVPPPDVYVPEYMEDESHYHMLIDKTWNTQSFHLLEAQKVDREEDPFMDPNIDRSIPLLVLASVSEFYGNDTAMCLEGGRPSS